MSGVSDEDFTRILSSEGAARGKKGPVKARLLPMDGPPGTEVPPYSHAPAPRPWLRLSLQMATIAVAAAVGWYSAGGGSRVPGNLATADDLAEFGVRLAAAETQAREREAALRLQQAADIAAVRRLVEGVGKDIEALRNGQRLVQAQRDEASLKLAQLTERLDKFEAAQMPTAAIARPAQPQVQAQPQTQPQSVSQAARPVAAKTSPPAPAPRARPNPPPGGYVLGEVRNGGAVVHGHRGPVDVWPGSLLPGAGRVQAILRRNGQWVVTTTNGEIDGEGY